MQSPPAVEGMYIHGILHRVEGDYDNARAWYADVCSTPAFTQFWGKDDPDDSSNTTDSAAQKGADAGKVTFGDDERWHDERGQKAPPQTSARIFLNSIEALRKSHSKQNGASDDDLSSSLASQSRAEIEALIAYCAQRFGTEAWTDAREAYVQPSEETRAMGQDMVSGGEGFRKF